MDDETRKAKILHDGGRLLEDTEYTPKGHYNMEDIWRRRRLLLGIPGAALAAGAGTTAATSLPAWATAALAFASALLTAAMTVMNPSEQARRSRVAADALKEFHERLRRWLDLDLPLLNAAEARLAYEDFAREKARLNEGAPPINQRSFRRARAGIEAGESTYQVDATD